MAVPAIVSMSPSRGPNVGGELVRLVVGDAAPQVAIWLGDRPVLFSAREEHTVGSVFWLRLPPLVIGEANLVVENLDERGRPVPGERAEWRGYTAEPSSLAVEGIVAAITREDGTVLIPRGDDELHAHDQLVVFVLGAMVDKVLALAGIERDD